MNISGYPQNDKKEMNGNNILEQKLGFNKFILHTKKEDKTPNYDGTLEVLDNKSKPIKTFFIQNKSIERINKNEQGKPYYDFETNFLNYIQTNITNDLGIYFVIDLSEEKVYYKIISKTISEELYFKNSQCTTRYYFKEKETLNNSDEFWNTIYNLIKSEKPIYQLYDEETIKELQDSCHYINTLFSTDLLFIKKMVFPNIWEFGIEFSQDKNHNGFKLIALRKGKNDESVRSMKKNLFNGLGKDELFGMCMFPSVNGDIIKFQDDVINKFIDEFFDNHCYFKLLPDEALMEKLSSYLIFDGENEYPLKDKYNEIFKSGECPFTKSSILIHKLFVELINRDILTISVKKETLNLDTIKSKLDIIPKYYKDIVKKCDVRNKFIISNMYKFNFENIVGGINFFDWNTIILAFESEELSFEIDRNLKFDYDSEIKDFKHYSSTLLYSEMIKNNTIVFDILVALLKATIYKIIGREKDFNDFIK